MNLGSRALASTANTQPFLKEHLSVPPEKQRTQFGGGFSERNLAEEKQNMEKGA